MGFSPSSTISSAQRAFAAVSCALALAACEDERAPGQLIVSIESDMALPQQLDAMQVSVLARGKFLLDQAFSLGGQTGTHLPATLTLVAGPDPSVPVTVRVAGRKDARFRTFRELSTLVPSDRSAILHMPLQWLCDGTATLQNASNSTGQPELRAQSSCDPGSTCRAGECAPSMVPSAALPSFTQEAVFGGADEPSAGACYDTLACMASGALVTPAADCSLDAPGDATAFNVALRVPNGGICDRDTLCFVPLDGESDEGFVVTGERVTLPRAVCKKLSQGLIDGVYVSTACATKTSAHPPCGSWSSVPDDHAIAPDPTQTAMIAPVVPALITTLPAGEQGVCCPLLQDSGKFYSCACESMTKASVFELPTSFGSPKRLATINPTSKRPSSFFAASVHRDALYWVGDDTIERTPLASSVQGFSVKQSGLYWGASLLTDERSVFALVSGVENAPSALQLFVLGHDQTPLPLLDTGSNSAVFQFDQDAMAVYLAADNDTLAADGGKGLLRASQVVRIRKQDGLRGDVLPRQQLQLDDKDHGGYVGVQVAGSHVFALYEDAPGSDGSMRVSVLRVDVSDLANLPPPASLTTLQIDPAHTRLSLLGAIDDLAFLSRVELDSSNTVRSSAVLAVGAKSAAQRILASYEADTQVVGIASDETRVYWLNQSGRFYSFPRSVLQ